MPYRSEKPCARAGCPKLTKNCYCPDHARAEARRYDKYMRDPESKKRYGHAWHKIRAAFLAAHPLCEMCERGGKLVPATLVHHKRKLSDGGTNDNENLMSLCHACHSYYHAKAGDRWGAG